MSGHSKWSQIKHHKGITDQKRGQLFSKLLRAIAIATKTDSNPQFNPRLRTAIETARTNNVPAENIERAISKASEEKNLEDILVEAYGSEGAALIIQGITDNSNRTVNEIKKILSDHEAKIATPGSVLWSFEQTSDKNWKPKFQQPISDAAKEKTRILVAALEEHEDVQKIITNIV